MIGDVTAREKKFSLFSGRERGEGKEGDDITSPILNK